jgi:hypothetical protein
MAVLYKTNHMPVRFLIYVAITALTRLLISNVSHHNPPDMGVVYLTGRHPVAGVCHPGGAIRLVAVPVREDREPASQDRRRLR